MPGILTTKEETVALHDGRTFRPLPILHTAEHAVAVYVEPSDYGFEVMRFGYEGGTVISRGAAQAGIAWSPRVIVITGRGSSEPGDWRDDLLSIFRRGWTPPAPLGARVGLGFRRQTIALAADVVDAVRQLRATRPEAQLIVTGHSLGAALVPKLVAHLDYAGIPTRFAVAHCAPRGGNRAWAEWYDSRFTYDRTPTWSIVNIRAGEPDMVTRVPKRRWGFRHTGRRVMLAGAADVLFGDAAWLEYRAENPVSSLAAWRVISRLIRSTSSAVRAHFGAELTGALRARIEWEPDPTVL